MLKIVRPAIGHLEACKSEATVNADLLDYFLFGAARMELIGKRAIDAVRVAEAYRQAFETADKEREKAVALLAEAERLVRTNRDAYERLGRALHDLWLAESKPYALDRTVRRYATVVKRYDELAGRLADAQQRARSGQPLLPPEKIGLRLP